MDFFLIFKDFDRYNSSVLPREAQQKSCVVKVTKLAHTKLNTTMGAGTGGAGWASAHPGKNQGWHGPPWKF